MCKSSTLYILVKEMVNTTDNGIIKWILSQCGVPRIERAGQMAKEGAAEEKTNVQIKYYQTKRIIK